MKKATIIILFVFVSCALNAQGTKLGLMKAAARLDEGKPYMVIQECNSGLSQYQDYKLYVLKGKALLILGNIKEAEEAFAMASRLSPGSGALGMAYLYSKTGENEKALSFLEIHLRSEFKSPEKDILLDPNFKKLESTSAWKEFWSNDWYTDLEDGISEAQYLVEKGRIDELADLVEYLRPLYKGHSGMEYIEALACKSTKDYKSELDHYRLALSGTKASREIWYAYIKALNSTGNYFESVEASSRALELFPEEIGLLLFKAEGLRKSGSREEAIKTVELFLEVLPENEEALHIAGDISVELNSYSNALRYYSSGIELYPGNPDNYIGRGDVYSVTSTWEFAISDYSMALDLKPDNAAAYFNKASALLKTGNRDDACRNFRMALRHGHKKASAEINRNCIR